ncbi:hypothetical protein HJP15_07505 [Pseudoalteromonas sp. NEC-BIFX-2020_002]|uniref:hypothetical protein n=1 Tax=Pseudoalteromonas sp. NEC-BIFX-2020_002 TaxID=2732353 RepID=UPI001477680A|nr:hypothetical protein [Pseudoalteromonas sp. NEC-BIFX-2020_002]NNG42764.1 hypothetical protein [Pseudoalteromonas sp. NEC-BIFX-2020_002]
MFDHQSVSLIDNAKFIKTAKKVLTTLQDKFPEAVLFEQKKAVIGTLTFLTFEKYVALAADNEHYVITQNGVEFLKELELDTSIQTTVGLAD